MGRTSIKKDINKKSYKKQENQRSVERIMTIQSKEKNESSNTLSSSDEEEECGTEIIPRFVPTPIQKVPPFFKMKILNSKSSQDELEKGQESTKSSNTTQVNSVCHEQEVLHNSTVTRKECSILDNNDNNKKMIIGSKDSMIKQLVFKSSTHSPTPMIASAVEDNYKSLSTVALVERTSNVLHKLSTLGLIGDSSSTTIEQQGSSHQDLNETPTVVSDCKKPCESFLSLLYSMLDEISEQQQHQEESIHKTSPLPTEIELRFVGLISMFEVLLEKYFNLSRKKTIMERQRCDTYNHQHLSRENIYPNIMANEGGLLFTSTMSPNLQGQEGSTQSSQTISLLQQENEILRRQLMEVDSSSQLMELQHELSIKHIECQKFQQIIQTFEQEHNHLHHKCEEKDAINFRFEKDLDGLRNSNQFIVKENEDLHAEVFRLTHSISSYEERLRQAEQSVHSSTMSRSEVMTKWNDALKERTSLESQVGQLSRELSVIKQQLGFSHDEIHHLKQQIEKLENESHERLVEISSCNRERNRSETELQVLKQSFDQIKKDNYRLREDVKSSQINTDMHLQKLTELQQVVAKTRYDAETCGNMASELEMERDALKTLLEEERTKIQKLQNELSAAKTRDVAAAEQMRKIVKEKALYVTKLNEANARNNHQQYGGRQFGLELTLPLINKRVQVTTTNKKALTSDNNTVQGTCVHTKGNLPCEICERTSKRKDRCVVLVGEKENEVTQPHEELLHYDTGRKDESINRRTITLSNEPTSLLEYLSGDDSMTIV